METNRQKAKSYVIIAQGGHCGNGYFIPMISWCRAQSPKEASEKIIDLARVKKDKKHAIMYVDQITTMEGLLIEFINNYDTYLTASNIDNELDSRRLNIPYMVEIYNNIQNGHQKNQSRYSNIDHIITRNSFSEDYPIQRHIAPYYDGNKYVYDKTIDMHELLRDFFTVSVKNIAMKKLAYISELKEKYDKKLADKSEIMEYSIMKREFEVHLLQFLMVYYKLFGKNNPLGITHDRSTHSMHFSIDGKPVSIEIPQFPFHGRSSLNCQAHENFSYYKNKSGENKNLEELIIDANVQPIYAETTQTSDDNTVEETSYPRPSQTEKFYNKFQKYLDIKNSHERER